MTNTIDLDSFEDRAAELDLADTDAAIDATIDEAGAAGDAADTTEELLAVLRQLQTTLERGQTDRREALAAEVLDLTAALRDYAVGAFLLGGAA